MADNGLAPQPPAPPPGRAQYDAMAANAGQPMADEWKTQESARLLRSGKFTGPDIEAYFGDDQPVTHAAAPAGIPQPHVATNALEAFGSGWDMSVTGLTANLNARNLDVTLHGAAGERPMVNNVLPQDASLLDKVLHATGQGLGDLPFQFAGMVGTPGTAGATGKVAVGGGGTEALRQLLITAYNFRPPGGQSAIQNFQDFSAAYGTHLDAIRDATVASGLGGGFGSIAGEGIAALGGGKLVGSAVSATTMAVTSTAVGGAMSGKMPDAQDFTAAAIMALGFEGAGYLTPGHTVALKPAGQRVASNLQQIYVHLGIAPQDALNLAAKDPAIRAEILAQDPNGDPVTPRLNASREPEPAHYVPPKPNPQEPGAAFGRRPNAAVGGEAPPAPAHMIANSVDEASHLLVNLEGSADNAVSKPAFAGSHGGAIGKYQIMPATARQYWAQVFPGQDFDVSRLFDPKVNEALGKAVITDLYNRFHGDMAAIAIAYNSGPGRASRYITKGPGTMLEAVPDKTQRGGYRYDTVPASRDESWLPQETQHYLANARRRSGGQLATGGEPAGHDGNATWDPSRTPEDVAALDAEAKRTGTGAEEPAQQPAGGRGNLSSASTWAGADVDTLVREVNSNIGVQEAPKATGSLVDRFADALFQLSPARRADNELIQAGLYDRTKELGIEDRLRQTYGAGSRAATFIRWGIVDPITKAIDRSASFWQAGQLVLKNGGNLDGWRAYMNAKRAADKGVFGPVRDQRLLELQAVQEQVANSAEHAAELRRASDKAVAARSKGLKNVTDREAFDAETKASPENVAADTAEKNVEAARKLLDKAEGRMKGIETGFNPFASAELIQHPEAIAMYEEATRLWNKTNDGVLSYTQQAGLHSEAQVAAMKEANPNYVSWRRLTGDDRPLGAGQMNNPAKDPRDPFYTMTGSDGKVTDPLAATMDNVRVAVANADRNMARLSIVDWAKENPDVATVLGLKVNEEKSADEDDGAYYDRIDTVLRENGFTDEQLPAARKAYEGLISQRDDANLSPTEFSYYRDGKRYVATVDSPVMAEMFRRANGTVETNFLTKMLRNFAKVERTGIVSMPDYGPGILIFHQLNQWIMDPMHPPPFVAPFRGIMHVLGQDKVFQEVAANGGFGASVASMDRDMLNRNFEDIFNGTGVWDKVRNIATSPKDWPSAALHTLQLVIETGDAANRVGLWKMGQEKGMSPEMAAVRARKTGLDYAEQSGSQIANNIASWSNFWRAHLLGMKQGYEAFEPGNEQERTPAGRIQKTLTVTAIATMAITAPKIGLYILNRELDKDKPEGQRYMDLPQFERDTHYVIPTPAGFVRLRLPANFGFVFGTIPERMMDALYDHLGPEAFTKNIAEPFAREYLPVPSSVLAQTPVELAANHNFNTGHALIPDAVNNRSPQMRYTENTSKVAIGLSRLIGPASPIFDAVGGEAPSPMQIDHVIDAFGGPMGQQALRTVDAPFHQRPPAELADNIFVKGFMLRNPGMNSQPIQDFYDSFRDFSQSKGDFSFLKKQAVINGQTQVDPTQFNVDQAAAASGFGKVEHALSTQRSLISMVTHSLTMNTDEKRQAIDNLYSQSVVIAQYGNAMMDVVKEHRAPDDRQSHLQALSEAFTKRYGQLQDEAHAIPNNAAVR